MEFGRVINNNIIIEPTSNMAFVVRVGCATFAYNSTIDLIADLEAYINNPAAYEKKYSEKREVPVGDCDEREQGNATVANGRG